MGFKKGAVDPHQTQPRGSHAMPLPQRRTSNVFLQPGARNSAPATIPFLGLFPSPALSGYFFKCNSLAYSYSTGSSTFMGDSRKLLEHLNSMLNRFPAFAEGITGHPEARNMSA